MSTLWALGAVGVLAAAAATTRGSRSGEPGPGWVYPFAFEIQLAGGPRSWPPWRREKLRAWLHAPGQWEVHAGWTSRRLQMMVEVVEVTPRVVRGNLYAWTDKAATPAERINFATHALDRMRLGAEPEFRGAIRWETGRAVPRIGVRQVAGSAAKVRYRDCFDLAVPPGRAGQHEYVVRFTVAPRSGPPQPPTRHLRNVLPTEGWQEGEETVRYGPRVEADIAFCVGFEEDEGVRQVLFRILSPVSLNPWEREDLAKRLAWTRGDRERRLKPTIRRITDVRSKGSSARRGARDLAPLTITRDGWPWPEEVPLYHATTALPTVLREGFKTRAEVGASALGGGPSHAVSLTYDPRIAESIALGLRVLRLGARREMSLRELLDAAQIEIPNAMPAVRKYLETDGITDRTIDLYDRGYVHESASPGGFGGAPLPQGAIGERRDFMGRKDQWASWWILGPRAREEWAVRGYAGNEPFYKVYQAILSFGESTKECFNPLFFGTDLAPLAKLRESDIGVLTVRARVPRICLDAKGTVELGYLGPKEAKYWGQWIAEEFGYRCAQDVDAIASRGKPWGEGIPSLRASWYAPKETLGAWTVIDEGERRPADTMAYLSSLAEIRVYDPRRIAVDGGDTIADLAQHARRWGHRLTYPYFSPVDDLVGLRPGTLVRQRGGAPWAGSENRRRR